MADNFLEKRYEEVFGKGAAKTAVSRPGLDSLILRNRSVRSFRKDYKVHPLQMDAILSVVTKIPSGMNAQKLRYRSICGGAEVAVVLKNIRLGAALPELQLPPVGSEPEAFIVVCCTGEEGPMVDIDLGIALQSMLLKAVEIGLNGVIIRNFDQKAVADGLGLPLNPIAILAIGKSAETVRIVPAHSGDSLKYYRENGVHCVPKLQLEDLKI